jgi:twinkle protein
VNVLPTNLDLDRYVDPPKDANRIVKPSEILDRVLERGQQRVYGATLPWQKTHNYIRFAPGQITVWAAPSGSFKSSLLSQINIGFCEQGQLVCVTSLEEPLGEYGFRMARQCWAADEPTAEQITAAHKVLDDRLWFWDAHGEMTAVRAVAMMRYCAYELGIQQFVFDNVTNVVDPSNDNTSEQWKFVRSAHRLARDSGMHVHLVMHTRKNASDHKERPPSADDIRGSGSIAQMVDQIFMPWRNLKKEDTTTEAGAVVVDGRDWSIEPDVTLMVEKAKFTSWRGRVKLWSKPQQWQFLSNGLDDALPTSLLGNS